MAKLFKNVVTIGALAAACSFVIWHRASSFLAHEGAWSDGLGHVPVGSGTERGLAWSAPERAWIDLTVPEESARMALAPDGSCIVFAAGTRGLNQQLYVAELDHGRAGIATPLARLNSSSDECSPAFGVDGLYFASNREGAVGGFDLYRAPYGAASYGAEGFGAVEHLAGVINSDLDELDPAPDPITGEVVFVRAKNGDPDLWSALRTADGWVPRLLETVSSIGVERDPCFAPGGAILYFASQRLGSDGFDLYRATRIGTQWFAPERIEHLCTQADERAPAVGERGLDLSFARLGDDGSWSTWNAQAVELVRRPTRPWTWKEIGLVAVLLLLAVFAKLSERWPVLDVFTRCLLVSLLIHVLFLWWSSAIYLEHAPVPDEPEVIEKIDLRLRMSAPPQAERADRMRAGSRGGLARAELGRRSSDSASDPGPRPAEAQAFEIARPNLAAARAPDRVAGAAPAAPVRGTVSATLRDAESRVVYDSSKGELTVDARASTALSRVGTSGGPERANQTLADAGSSVASRALSTLGLSSTTQLEVPHGGGAAAVAAPTRGSVEATGDALAALRASAGASVRDKESIAPALGASAAPGFALSSPLGVGARGVRASDAPVRAALGGGGTGSRESEPAPGVTSIDAGAVGQKATAPSAPGRVAELTPHASSVAGIGVGLQDRESRVPGLGSDSTALAVEPAAASGAGSLDAARAEHSSGDGGAQRGALGVPSAGASHARPGDAGLGELLAGAVRGGVAEAPTAARGSVDVSGSAAGSATRGSDLALQDREKLEPAHGDDGGGSSVDPLASMGAGTTARSDRNGDGSLPERESTLSARGSAEPAPAPASIPAVASASAPDRTDGRPARSAWEDTPYQNRSGPEKLRALVEHGGDALTEEAFERGLAYLARIQHKGGHWGPLEFEHDKYGQVAVGKSALVLLAFLGAGHTHVSSTKYSENVRLALGFLTSIQDESSGHFGSTEAYGHGISTYALAELYALTKDEGLRPSLERALAHMLDQQNDRRGRATFGGFGYYYPDGRVYDSFPRTSITAWHVMALESARLSGLAVPDQAFQDAGKFLDGAKDDEQGWYRYNHDPVRLRSEYATLPASTPAALFALSLLGRNLTDPRYADAIAFVVERAPRGFKFTNERDFVRRGQGNPYFWYYGTLAMFRAGGAAWELWNETMKSTLLPAQSQDGSWRPIDVYAEYARDDDRDRSYTTALCVLSLEIYYRYFLPLLKVR